jgi:ketosteroid isomerase-like protein
MEFPLSLRASRFLPILLRSKKKYAADLIYHSFMARIGTLDRRLRRGPAVCLLLLAVCVVGVVAGACRSDRAGPEANAQVVQAIKDHEDQFFAAMRRGDVDAMVEVYTDDAISLAPGAPLVRGKAALREFWTRYLQDTASVDVDHETVVLEHRDDLLYEVSTYVQTIHWKNGKVTEDRGKWLTVKKQQPDGSWKTHIGAWSSDSSPDAIPSPE